MAKYNLLNPDSGATLHPMNPGRIPPIYRDKSTGSHWMVCGTIDGHRALVFYDPSTGNLDWNRASPIDHDWEGEPDADTILVPWNVWADLHTARSQEIGQLVHQFQDILKDGGTVIVNDQSGNRVGKLELFGQTIRLNKD